MFFRREKNNTPSIKLEPPHSDARRVFCSACGEGSDLAAGVER